MRQQQLNIKLHSILKRYRLDWDKLFMNRYESLLEIEALIEYN
jgi:hypothetical protein